MYMEQEDTPPLADTSDPPKVEQVQSEHVKGIAFSTLSLSYVLSFVSRTKKNICLISVKQFK